MTATFLLRLDQVSWVCDILWPVVRNCPETLSCDFLRSSSVLVCRQTDSRMSQMEWTILISTVLWASFSFSSLCPNSCWWLCPWLLETFRDVADRFSLSPQFPLLKHFILEELWIKKLFFGLVYWCRLLPQYKLSSYSVTAPMTKLMNCLLLDMCLLPQAYKCHFRPFRNATSPLIEVFAGSLHRTLEVPVCICTWL